MGLQTVIDSLTKIVTDILNFIPNLVNGLIILIVGVLIARLIRWIAKTILSRVGFDPRIERTGVTGSIRGLGVTTPASEIIAQTLFILLLLSFLITATQLMGLGAVARVLEQVLTFLPNLIAALIVFLLGGVVSQFMGNLVTTMATGGGLSYAARLGRLIQYIISVFVVIIALGVLGLDTALLVTAVTILIGAFGLALGLGLGLGARGLIFQMLSGYYVRQRFPTDTPVTIGDVSGVVRTTGSINTVLATDDGEVVVPNGTLLDQIVRSPAPPAVSAVPIPPAPLR